MEITTTRSFFKSSGAKTALPYPGLHQFLTEQENVCYKSKTIIYKKGESIYKPGKNLRGIYEVLSGAVRISYISESGEEVTSEILTQTEIFGNLKGSAGNFTEYSKALTDSTIKIYDAELFSELKSVTPELAAWFSDYAVNRWSRLERRLLRINAYKTSDNVAFLYRELNRKITNAEGREERLIKLITQKDIADIAGATRQTVSSVIKEIEHRGG